MLLTLGINHLNPHQATSVLGQIITNDLAWTWRSITEWIICQQSHLFHGRLLFISIQKYSQCKYFYDNGGEYGHQYNDTVQEFHLHLSGSEMKNTTTTTAHIHTLLASMFERKKW